MSAIESVLFQRSARATQTERKNDSAEKEAAATESKIEASKPEEEKRPGDLAVA